MGGRAGFCLGYMHARCWYAASRAQEKAGVGHAAADEAAAAAAAAEEEASKAANREGISASKCHESPLTRAKGGLSTSRPSAPTSRSPEIELKPAIGLN